MSMATISSTNSGLPSAMARMRAAHPVIDPGRADEVAQEVARVGLGQGLEQHGRRVELAAAPPWPGVEQLGAGHDQQQQRRVARPVGHVLDEIDEGRLGPLQVIDEQDHRPAAGEGLEDLAHRPEGLLGRHRVARRLQQLGHAATLSEEHYSVFPDWMTIEELCQSGTFWSLANHDQAPVRRPGNVG